MKRPLRLISLLAVLTFAFSALAGTAFAAHCGKTCPGGSPHHGTNNILIDITGAGILIDITGAGVVIGNNSSGILIDITGAGVHQEIIGAGLARRR